MIRHPTLAPLAQILLALLLFSSLPVASLYAVSQPGSYARMELETTEKVRSKVKEILNRYCGRYCELVDVKADVVEDVADGDDMGFESVVAEGRSTLIVDKVLVRIQIDRRVGRVNRERLNQILDIHLKPFAMGVELDWNEVRLPNITGEEDDPGFLDEDEFERGIAYSRRETVLRNALENRLAGALNKVISRYCPSRCILERIEIRGKLVPIKKTAGMEKSSYFRRSGTKGAFIIDNIDVDVSMDQGLAGPARDRITGLMKSRSRFANPVNFNVSLMEFPETYAGKRERERRESEDPHGLNKMKEMLKIFRELAGTKEVIRETTNNSTKTSNTTDNVKSESTNKALQNTRAEDLDELTPEEKAAFAAGFILLLTLVGIVLMKFYKANRDANAMMNPAAPGYLAAQQGENRAGKAGSADEEEEEDPKEKLSLHMRTQELRDELVDLFIENPRVAKETFSRLLKEDGVEETAQYVHVFGHMVVFELLNDPNYQRDLYELSEYYHNSEFEFDKEEELELLVRLKTRVTASEIRVLTRKASEKFEFLTRLDAAQVYNLIVDEKPRVQSIVLTQLDRKKRASVFDLFKGEQKVALMSELSEAEAIPKDFLFNVAKALSKKVANRPDFDTQNLRASDILLDLLEKARLEDQQQLMATLQRNNPDTARGIKLKLVTIQMMPYLKDGHLLELILGMERDDLLAFLMGTEDKIRNLLLSKAPEELSDSWLEDMENMASVDEQAYRLVEMKVISRIRNLGNNGVISLMDINEKIFDTGAKENSEFAGAQEELPAMNKSTEVA